MPTDKVSAGVLAGALTTIIFWVVEVATSLDPPAAVVAATTTLLAFVAGYFKRETNPAPG